jgi:hypothetical protein
MYIDTDSQKLMQVKAIIIICQTLNQIATMSFWSVTNKNADIGKVSQSGTVKQEMLTEATFNQTNF